MMTSVHALAFSFWADFNDGIYDNVLSHSNAYRAANQALDSDNTAVLKFAVNRSYESCGRDSSV